ncbi:DUF228 domain-containing protein (plasmid) [Borrelia miyamotoi]|uniref:DUF228 domain-containing protein n=1 Tax=Borrelia miyamotoi TaxID=47466 RepID=A0ABY7VPL8_9SPIR|nr:DUF228 domain-containing protein [Borrelia miyamotoi]ATQ15417.1 DUF228 domain-containing protein [Borrelia miyamotoi]ATQ20453.2 DUF228 domain-containing protein [Borrelia miyamotoi]ATQ21507.1 DUF228 domain-containing protein [Borrelia miyamotoi]QBK63891.1 DUF228 domain-containing protein [Borrelia miyamotoi]QBK65159.1 DUF228 domain-containing protein [Borrelia miyamotoi]
MSSDITQLIKDYETKRDKLKGLMKNPSSYRATFSNNTDFRDKHLHFSNSGGTATSRKTKLENHPMKGYPYKRGVKRVVNPFVQGQPHFEPHVEAGGGDDLYGICIDVDDFTRTATVVPITEIFEGYLVAKDNSIKKNDKLKFNSDGQLEKANGSTNINAIAISDSIQLSNDLYMVEAISYGNKALN